MSNVTAILLEVEAATKNVPDFLAWLEEKLEHITNKYTHDPIVVVLPENFLFYSADQQRIKHFAQSAALQELLNGLGAIAARYGIWLIAGSLPILEDDGNLYIETLCFNETGGICSRYKKNHLFRAKVAGTLYDEGQVYKPGRDLTILDIGGIRFGLAICFDLRFPEMFMSMRELGVDAFVVPAAFTAHTGKLVWESLLKVRALENQCFVLGCGLVGIGENGCDTWGHSMVVAPDGSVMEDVCEGMVAAKLSINRIQQARQDMPLHQNMY